MSKPLTVTSDNFENEVLKSDMPVLLDFYAVWCQPCKMLSPVIEELADDYDGKIKVAKLNVDNNVEIAAEYSVMSIPTIILFKDGNAVSKLTGLRPKSDFTDMIDENINDGSDKVE